jgi:hypothetical protein
MGCYTLLKVYGDELTLWRSQSALMVVAVAVRVSVGASRASFLSEPERGGTG